MGFSLDATLARLDEGRRIGQHLGGQLCVLRRGALVADLAFGDVRPGEPMTTAHRMLWLSSGKPVAALAIAQLWERGRLGLDDPVARHLPEFGAAGKEGVTVRHLLTHTAGLRMPEVGWPESSWEEILARICAHRLEPRWVPGRKAGYHPMSTWFVLGEIVRRLDGREFPRYARDEIFLPLGMSDCWLGGMPDEEYERAQPWLAPLWRCEGEPEMRPWHSRERLTRSSPGSNGCGPMRQLARFYEMLRCGGELDGVRLLAPQTVEALVARHRVGLFDHTFRAQLDWGLGVIVNSAWHGEPEMPYGYGPHASSRTFGHSGAQSSTGFCDPEPGLVVALAVNGMPSEATHRLRFHQILAALFEDLGLVGL